MKIGYMRNGGMGYADEQGAHALPSQRVEKYQRTLEDLEQRYAWKTQGSGAQFMNQSNPYRAAAHNAYCRVTGLAPYGDRIVYAADMNGEIGGLYVKDVHDLSAPEGLVVSDRFFDLCDLHVRGDALYGAKLNALGQRHIALFELPGGQYRLLTEGDTVERHPFVCAHGRTLVYDCAGYSRKDAQAVPDLGPSEVVELDLSTGQMRTILADEKVNYLKYTQGDDGARYVMARPYRPPQPPKANPLGCVVAPFSALLGFIHVFSALNAARKGSAPPMRGVAQGAPPARSKGEDWIGLDGLRVDANRALRENEKGGEAYPGIAPRDWQLLRLNPDGGSQVLRRGVADYCLLPGGYAYTNGLHIVQVAPDGTERLLCKDRVFDQIALIG